MRMGIANVRASEPCESREPCEPSVRAIQIFENAKKKKREYNKIGFYSLFFSVFPRSIDRGRHLVFEII